jgi:hypothetical protein
MEVVEGCNYEIVNYFTKFKNNNNYEVLLEKFKDLTRLRLKGTIKLNQHNIPDIGPSDDLPDFIHLLKNWREEDIMEIKNVIKLYDTGQIESLEEAIILIHVLRSKTDDYPKILDTILNDLEKQEFKDIEKYNDLLSFQEDTQDSIIYNGIWNYLIMLLA